MEVILKEKFSQIAESKLKQPRWRANSEATIGEGVDESDLMICEEWMSSIKCKDQWMFSFGKWRSWKRCQGSVLQGFLKKDFRRAFQIRWWILCHCGENKEQ